MSSIEQRQEGLTLAESYVEIRGLTEELCRTLSPEDATLQSMPDASPARWHLAHTTWFFETFLLREQAELPPFRPEFEYLFNSYYNAVGRQFPRPRRGLISRPSLEEIYAYRRYVDETMLDLIARSNDVDAAPIALLVELGLNHEQQHQELILTDVKHALSFNPLMPAYRTCDRERAPGQRRQEWIEYPGGVHDIGHKGDAFSYDNESPRHETLLRDYQLADRLVTCGEYEQFVRAGGYNEPNWWLSDGWRCVQEEEWNQPLYWFRESESWMHFTLAGPKPIDPAEPVCHLSYYEADAYARWVGARLPTEAEWEVAAAPEPIAGNFVDTLLPDDELLHPRAAAGKAGRPQQLYGDVWEWTASPYVGYPGYQPAAGALGEYNGKFMCNQFVLRGGSCATSSSHVRATYRNFFAPNARWQFAGLRLARDVG